MEIINGKAKLILNIEELETMVEKNLTCNIIGMLLELGSTEDEETVSFEDALLMIKDALNLDSDHDEYIDDIGNEDDRYINQLYENLIGENELDYN